MMGPRAWLSIVAAMVGGMSMPACSEFDPAVVERVAEVEHEQWMAWSKDVAAEVSPERRSRWQKFWIPYKDLPDEVKELDREWARKALRAAKR